MARTAVEQGFVPPPYPHDRLGELRAVAAATPGGIIDASVGTPVDPTPEIVVAAATSALREATGYPATIGSPQLREAAAGWLGRRFGVEIDSGAIVACIGTKEVVASLPRLLSLRDPGRDTVLYPALSYPTYAMGATLAGLRAVPVPVDERWHPDLTAIDEGDAERALLLWCNDPANPTGVTATASGARRVGAVGTGAGHRGRERRVLRGAHLRPDWGSRGTRRRPLRARTRASSPCTRCPSARTWRASAWASSPATPSSSSTWGRCASTPG